VLFIVKYTNGRECQLLLHEVYRWNAAPLHYF